MAKGKRKRKAFDEDEADSGDDPQDYSTDAVLCSELIAPDLAT